MSCHAGVSSKRAVAAAESANSTRTGEIEWSEFVAVMLPSSPEICSAALDLAFRHFDANRDGYIDQTELVQLLQSGQIGKSGSNLPLSFLPRAVLNEIDADGDGLISAQESSVGSRTCRRRRPSRGCSRERRPCTSSATQPSLVDSGVDASMQ